MHTVLADAHTQAVQQTVEATQSNTATNQAEDNREKQRRVQIPGTQTGSEKQQAERGDAAVEAGVATDREVEFQPIGGLLHSHHRINLGIAFILSQGMADGINTNIAGGLGGGKNRQLEIAVDIDRGAIALKIKSPEVISVLFLFRLVQALGHVKAKL